MKVAVAGGTGTAGRAVVASLRRQGHEPVVLARAHGVDVRTGEGLGAAMSGVDALVDVTNTDALTARSAEAFFTATTRQLVAAVRAHGVRHHVTLSIVGIDRIGYGYYRAKLHQERQLAASGAPITVVRATQFHEFAGQYLERLRGPVVPVLAMPTQPVAAADVADILVEVAGGEPVGTGPEVAGPREERLVDMVRRLLAATGRRRVAVEITPPTRWGQAFASGAALPAGAARCGVRTFDEWLASVPLRRRRSGADTAG